LDCVAADEFVDVLKASVFTLTFDVTDNTRSDTSLIFIPEMHYRSARLQMCANDSGSLRHDWARQTVEYRHRREAGEPRRKVVRISLAKGRSLI
jgi:hypothetical protein